ncbi:MAG: hypothetical protein ACKVWV_19875 [Planctomycetota bacterium]
MRFVFAVVAALLVPACTMVPKTGAPRAADGRATESAPAAPTKSAASPDERAGVFAPDGASAISISPEAWRGELAVLEVVPHGTTVAEGDVLVRLDMRAIDDDVRQAELELASTEVRHDGLLAKNRVDEDAARSLREKNEAEVARSTRALDGYKTKELDFARRGDELSKERTKSNVEDQVDELTQLEAMYKGDELVEATEDIVLKRSKRDLALTRTSQALQEEQIRYRVEYDRARETEVREEAVRQARDALSRLLATQVIERRAREDAEKRSRESLAREREKVERLRRDRERMLVKAPRAGVCLHGAAKDYHPGRAPKGIVRGQALAAKSDVLLVADAEPRVVALDVPESRMDAVPAQAPVHATVRMVAGGASATGALTIDPYPSAAATADDALHEARVKLAAPIPGALYGMRARVTLVPVNP